MKGSSDSLRKLAECVDALREVDGVTVEEHDITEQPRGGVNPIEMFMSPNAVETEEVLAITLSLDDEGPGQEHPDPDKSGAEKVEDGTEVEIE